MKRSLSHISGRLIFVLFIWMMMNGFAARAVRPTPVITCLAVDPDGSVWISWINIDPDVLVQNIYYSTDGTNYSPLGSGNSPYHDVTADAAHATRYFYIKAVYTDTTIVSVPAQTMLLSANQPSGPGGGLLPFVELSWYKMYNDSTFLFEIWQEYPIGSWNMIKDGVTNTLYKDTLQDNICNDTVSYRVEVESPSGCRSVSSIGGGWFTELNQPLVPVFDSITVNAAGKVVLTWAASASADVRSTIIYRNGFDIDTIPVSFPSEIQMFVDTVALPCENANLVYSLAAEDNCGNKGTMTNDQKLSPVFQKEIVTQICEGQNVLGWNPFFNANPPLDGYQILYSLNGEPFKQAGEVDAVTTSFIHENILQDTTYTYAIRAKFGNKTSTSCQKIITTGKYIEPAFLYLVNSSVLPNNQVEVTVDVDTAPISCSWEVYRAGTLAPVPLLIKTFLRSDVTNNLLVFIDETADGSLESYDYQIVVMDSCNLQRFISNSMTTMLLSGDAISNEENHLQWNAFTGFDAGVKQYRIFRMSDPGEPILVIDSVNPGAGVLEYTYTDQLVGQFIKSGVVTYWIEAQENSGNSYGFQEQSLSNRLTFAQETGLYMPTGFRPGGLTPVFK
ncbi:MAG: fibronectin type III domain-containing protein, partial [Bacteroidales bacterium]